ncbi:hypothetical protein [Streptomyces eurocidicus]|uniref:Uncharacterized protein n=1 Tax=Streptomyces eurocidicus TaxID=66423 RepID=A0A7W8BD23_STREU|nr:hypothetical protein [Streptomyces eurocidicus]MBB5120593.1 hypothetical protein [Streptomyces eurocidicus]
MVDATSERTSKNPENALRFMAPALFAFRRIQLPGAEIDDSQKGS